MPKIACFVIILLACLKNAKLKHQVNGDWDVLIFTQRWPATVCRIWLDKPNHSCAMPHQQDSWSIHGIWPTKLHTLGPSFCNKTWQFDPAQVQTIEDELEDKWINIEKETSTYSLWAHEWSKHGTCAAVINRLDNELKYFSQGLYWLRNYTMTNILERSHILPSDVKEYKTVDFYNAVRHKLGVNPDIQCHYVDGKQYLFEIRICFTKQLELTDCDGVKFMSDNGGLTNCKDTVGIIYPHNEKPPKRVLVQLYKFTNWLQWLTL